MKSDPLDESWGIPAVTLPGQVLLRLNRARQEAGVPPLSPRATLMAAAQACASDRARRRLASSTPEGGGMAGYARRAGHPVEVAGWTLHAPSAEVGLLSLLRDEGVLEVLRDPRCHHVGVGLRAGYFALLLEAPFLLDEAEAVGRVHMLLDHARAVRGAAPLRPSEALARLAEDALSTTTDAPAPADDAAGAPLRCLFQATLSTLDRAVRAVLAEPGVGPALLAPAGGAVGVAVLRRQDRLCLVFAPSEAAEAPAATAGDRPAPPDRGAPAT